MLTIATILFDNFETLDVFGPVEVFGRFPERLGIGFYSVMRPRNKGSIAIQYDWKDNPDRDPFSDLY